MLEGVVAGTHDLGRAREFDKRRRESTALFLQIAQARKEGRPEEALSIVDRVIALDPQTNGWAWAMKYEIALADMGDTELGASIVKQFRESEFSRNPEFDYSFGYRIESSIPQELRDLDLAVEMIRRAIELSRDDPQFDYFYHLAYLLAQQGRNAEAIVAIEKAIPLAPESDRERLGELLKQLSASAEP